FDPQSGGEAMEFIEVVGEQVTPFQPLPEPNRRIDIYGHRIAQLVGKSADMQKCGSSRVRMQCADVCAPNSASGCCLPAIAIRRHSQLLSPGLDKPQGDSRARRKRKVRGSPRPPR